MFALLCAQTLQGQQLVRMRQYQFLPTQHASPSPSQTTEPSEAIGGWRNVIIQFAQIPNRSAINELERKGIRLGDYLGGNAYFALQREGNAKIPRLRGANQPSAIISVQPEWKIDPDLAKGSIPSWAIRDGKVRITVRYAPAADSSTGKVCASAHGMGMRLSMLTMPIAYTHTRVGACQRRSLRTRHTRYGECAVCRPHGS